MIPIGLTAGTVVSSLLLARWMSRTGHRKPDDLVRLRASTSWWTVPISTMLAAAAAIWLPVEVALPTIVLVVAGAAISWIDIDVHRIPNRVLLVLAAVLAITLLWSTWSIGDPWRLLHALFGSMVLGGGFLVVALIGSMGMGDVKLAAVYGSLLGYTGWPASLGTAVGITAVLGFLIAVWVSHRHGRKSHMPYGPAIIAGTLLTVAVQAPPV